MSETMNGHQSRIAGKVLLAVALIASLTACSGSGSSHQPGATSSSPSTSPGPSPKNVAIPPVAGDSVQIADQVLATAGLGPPKKEVRPNIHYPQGVVTTTNPAMGTSVSTKYVVTLIVSGGITQCISCAGGGVALIMPNICGLSVQKADTLLAEKGITLNPRVIRQASSQPTGSIISSTPAARVSFVAYGGRAAREVTVTISSGETASLAPTPSAGKPNACLRN
jgi:beta-lactam-binding protein with PASTA domain